MSSGDSAVIRDIKGLGKKIKKLTKDPKKLLIATVPYLAVAYFINKVSYAFRVTDGGNAIQRLMKALEDLGAAFKNPLPSFHPKDLLIGAAAGAILWLVIWYKKKNRKKFRNGEEYGSARWGSQSDIENFMDTENEENNIILSKTEGIILSGKVPPKYARNKNVMVIGGSGSGKTRFFIKPNIMQMHSSYVVTDPKGTILVECGKMLKEGNFVYYDRLDKNDFLRKKYRNFPKDGTGRVLSKRTGKPIKEPYVIKVINTINFSKSMHYNPFAYIQSEQDILSFVNALVANTKGEGDKSGEDFWVQAEKLLYTAYIGYIYYECDDDSKNFEGLIDMINASETKEEDEDFKNAIDFAFEDLANEDPDHFAVKQYAKYKLAAGKTAKSILISCGARLAPFDIKELRECTHDDQMELDKLGDRKTALFMIMSDTDPTFNFLLAIMQSQLFNLLCKKADDVYGGRLPVHVRCLLDEFANVGQIPHFDKLIATIRSREISASIVLQSKSQLKTLYKDAADTITGNCDTQLFLGGTETTTLKEMSEMLGKSTIDLYNTSNSRGQSESTSTNYQKTGRDLMSQDELAVMDRGKCIVRIGGLRPFLSDKYDITKHKRYSKLSDENPKNAFDVTKELKTSQKLVLNKHDIVNFYEIRA